MTMTNLLLAAALALAAPSSAADVVLRSGPARTRLIELYSSEGCSSCPPADDWINALARSPRLWKDFVPVVFHVTYWDYIGWKDLYANPAYDARQRAESSAWGERSTYTPGLALDGEEWRDWGGVGRNGGRERGPHPASRVRRARIRACGMGRRRRREARAGGGRLSSINQREPIYPILIAAALIFSG